MIDAEAGALYPVVTFHFEYAYTFGFINSETVIPVVTFHFEYAYTEKIGEEGSQKPVVTFHFEYAYTCLARSRVKR